MAIQKKISGNTVEFIFDETFSFSAQGEFRKLYESGPFAKNFSLNFERTRFIDSSVLGMLLLFKDYVDGRGQPHIVLVNCTGQVKATLEVAKFSHFFDISEPTRH